MHDVLIALQTDLASSIAIRYVCLIENFLRFNIQVVHIPTFDENGHSPGSGWVHQTWKNAIIEYAEKGISRLVQKENFYRYSMGKPKIIPGQRNQVILKELQYQNYDFLIEGFLHSFEPDRFFKKLDSDLYRNLPCPVLMVQNLVKLDRGIQIVGTPDTILSVLPWFFKFWDDLPVKADILVCHFDTSNKEIITIPYNDNNLICRIKESVSNHEKRFDTIRSAKGSSNKLASLIRDHALVISLLSETSSPMAHMLAMSPCPILLCPEPKTN